MTWDPSLETGLERIDAEHKHLFEFIDLIGAANADQKRRIITGKLLDDFYELTRMPYEGEEDFMFRADFDAINGHISDHSLILNTLRMMIEDFNRTNEAQPVLDYIATALAGHMKSEDRVLAGFIQSKRRAKAAGAKTSRIGKGAAPR